MDGRLIISWNGSIKMGHINVCLFVCLFSLFSAFRLHWRPQGWFHIRTRYKITLRTHNRKHFKTAYQSITDRSGKGLFQIPSLAEAKLVVAPALQEGPLCLFRRRRNMEQYRLYFNIIILWIHSIFLPVFKVVLLLLTIIWFPYFIIVFNFFISRLEWQCKTPGNKG